MSLETVIAENTAALKELIATLKAGAQTDATPPKAAGKKPAQQPASAPPAPTAPAASAPAASPPAAAAAPKIPVKDVADALIALVNAVSRDAGVALLAKYGATKVPELKADNYAAFIADAKAQMPGTETPGAGLI